MSTAANMNAPELGTSRLGDFKYKTIEGLRVRYATSEKASGDPILLLSPWPESIYAYLPTWDVFS